MGPKPIRHVFCGDSHASPQPLRACSACAGDYEDPDRTAWTAETEEHEPLSQETARTSLREALEEAENETGDEGVNGEDASDNDTHDELANDDEFPAKET